MISRYGKGCHTLGPQHSMFEWGLEHPNGALLEIDGGRLRCHPPDEVEANRAPSWRSLRPLPEFMAVHRHRLDGVVRSSRSSPSTSTARDVR
jgi:hypothetical protein